MIVLVKNVKVILRFPIMGRAAFQIFVMTDKFLINLEIVKNAHNIQSLNQMVKVVMLIFVMNYRRYLLMELAWTVYHILEHHLTKSFVDKIFVIKDKK